MPPRKYETKEKTSTEEGKKEYMKFYMRDFRSLLKAKHELQDKCEKDIEHRFIKIKEPTGDLPELEQISGMALITLAYLHRTNQKVRKMYNLDDIMKVYRELWKELETQEAKIKEL